MKLSVIIPVYNERATIEEIVRNVEKVPLEKEIIIVDDASCDGTREIIENLKGESIKKVFHKKNQGKGAAVRSALTHIEGDIVIIQDADLEYYPDEYPQLIKPMRKREVRLKAKATKLFGILTISLVFIL